MHGGFSSTADPWARVGKIHSPFGEGQPPRFVAGYEILGTLGHGGMGIVFQARQVGLKRLVALKMLLADSTAGPQERNRFRIEAEAVARLQHPNIVQIHEVGEHDGRPYFSMEHLEGGSLAQKLGATPLPPRAAAQLVETLGRAIHFAHQRGIIHRDLKPANILLAADGTPKITDFGLAKRLDDDSGQTASGAIMGTPSYMSPEQAEGRIREIGPATDVYALGALFYETLTGRVPFKGTTLVETLEQVRKFEPVPLSRLQPTLPRDLETICLKCLQKEPRKRYSSAEEVAEDLRRFLNGEPIRARPIGRAERMLKWAKRRPTAALLAGFSAAAVVVLASLLVWHGVDLQTKVRQATEDKRRTLLESDARESILKAEAALSAGESADARLLAGGALEKMGSEASLADLRAQAEGLCAEAKQKIAQQEAVQRAQVDDDQFMKAYDNALFHGTVFTGVNLPANLGATEKAVREALGVFALSPEGARSPAFPPSFTAERKTRLTAACYELLLILAEIVARQDPPDQAGKAIAILDRAETLAPPTRAYSLRRSRYRESLGDRAGAEQDRLRAQACPVSTALDCFLLGEDQRRQGHLPKAAEHFQQALRFQADHFWAHYSLAVCYLQLPGRAGEAKGELTACLGLKRDFVWIHVLRGVAHALLGEHADAEADFGTALTLHPDKEAAYSIFVNRGALRRQEGRFAEAVADLQQAIATKPDPYQAYLILAKTYQEQQQHVQAGAALAEAIAAAQRLRKNNELESSALALVYRHRALHRRALDDLDGALQDFEAAIRVESAESKSLSLAQDHAEKGHILQLRKAYPEALAAYGAATQIRPDFADAHRWRGEVLFELQRYEESLRAFNQYLQRRGKPTANLYHARGLAHSKTGHHPAAIDDYTQEIAINPSSPGYAARGWVHLVADAPGLALRDFEEALRLDVGNGDAHNGRGFAHLRLGKTAAALADAEEALRRGPETPRLLWNAGSIFAQVVGKLDADPKQQTRQALEARFRYQDRSVKLLRQALAAEQPAEKRKQFWKENILPDRTLNPIRQSPGFLRLAAAYAEDRK